MEVPEIQEIITKRIHFIMVYITQAINVDAVTKDVEIFQTIGNSEPSSMVFHEIIIINSVFMIEVHDRITVLVMEEVAS